MPTTHYIWDTVSDSYLMETDENGNITAEYITEPVPYGRVISQRRSGVTSFYHYDGQGSTRQLTDESGNVTDECTYSAFGETVASSGKTVSPFGYKGSLGYYMDRENKSFYARARNYNPNMARWLVLDLAWQFHDVNRYMYVGNSPIVRSDPSGHAWTVLDAFYHYETGFGRSVTLKEIGLYNVITTAIQLVMDLFKQIVLSDAAKVAKAACRRRTLITFDRSSEEDIRSSPVFWIGGFKLYQSAKCSIYCDEYCVFNGICDFEFEMKDTFEYPFDLDNSDSDPWDRLNTGFVYDVKQIWNDRQPLQKGRGDACCYGPPPSGGGLDSESGPQYPTTGPFPTSRPKRPLPRPRPPFPFPIDR